MRRFTKLAAVAATAAALSLGLCGCSGSGTAAGAAQGATHPLAVAVYDGPTIVANYNPYSPMTNGMLKAMLYPPLWGYNMLQNGEVKYFLAKDFKWSQDAKTITIHLNPDLSWSDGSKLTAQDVAFSFQYAQKNSLTTLKFASVEATDDTTVTATFTTPSLSNESSLAAIPIVPEKVWKDRDPLDGTNPNPVTSGPYTLEKATSQVVQLKARDTYFKNVPVKDLRLVMAGTTVTQQLLSGDIQWTAAGIANPKATFVDVNPKTNHRWVLGTAVKTLNLNTSKAPFNNVHVRKGISLALDRQRIADAYNKGDTTPVTATGLTAEYSDKWIVDKYNYSVKQDTTAALAEFAKAGYTQQNGKLLNSKGEGITMGVLAKAGMADGITYTREVVEELKKIGIDATLQTVPASGWTTQMKDGNYDATLVAQSYDMTPYGLYAALMSTKSIPPNGANYQRWSDPATDAAFDEYLAATNTDQQHDAMDKVEDIVVNQLPFIPLITHAAPASYTTTYWTNWPDASNPYAAPIPWGSAMDTLNTVLNLKPAA